MSAPAPPLEGAVVVSAGHTLPGLYCLALLRDLGAEVVRVERLGRRGRAGPYSALSGVFPTRSLDGGTSELSLDLKNEKGRDVLHRIAGKADVVQTFWRAPIAAAASAWWQRSSREG